MKRIAIHSVPRSGSSWLGQIFNSHPKVIYKYQPLFSYAFKDALDEHSEIEEIIDFFNHISCKADDFLDQVAQIRKGNYPRFEKSENPEYIVYKEVRYHHIIRNLLAKDEELKVIGLIRNPLAVINSWLRAPREFREDLGWRELEEWRYAPKKNLGKKEEFHGFEKWKEVAGIFHELEDKYPDRFYLMRYDKLLSDTLTEVQRVFEFCGLSLSAQTKNFLKKSRTQSREDAYSVFREKGKTDDNWKSQLNPLIARAIREDLKDTELEQYLAPEVSNR